MALEALEQGRSAATNDEGVRRDFTSHTTRAEDTLGDGDEAFSIARLKGHVNDAPVPLELVKEAVNQQSNDLLQERTTIKSFVDAASDIANHYGHSFTTNARTETAVLDQQTESNDVKDITRPHQTNADEHLKQMRQTIDKSSLQKGAINQTGIEAGVADAESAASESLAALI